MTMPENVPRTDELRIALVLNGGVSLAVWMGAWPSTSIALSARPTRSTEACSR
jgi:hypothetical protein